jgi:hypothetical protein
MRTAIVEQLSSSARPVSSELGRGWKKRRHLFRARSDTAISTEIGADEDKNRN